jgi:hypothetical protein
MRSDDPELPSKTLSMFRQGFDTYAMSLVLEINEWIIERALHVAMSEPKDRERHA